jgi:uncharacterized protein YjbI with pentapeptide repeats
MGRIVELPSTKPRPTTRGRGLRKLSPDLISKARDETATQVTRIGLTFLGTAAFCLLSLLSPDTSLLGGTEKVNVPFAGPVSFFGFMLLGPAVLIVLRVYLQIYVEHSDRLDRLARSVSVVRAPTLVPLQNSLIRLFSGLIFYILLPLTMMLFAWKAGVFPAWGSGLFGVAVAVITSHVMLPFSRFSWRSKGLLSLSAAIVVGFVMVNFGPLHRPFNLERANLSDQWLPEGDLRRANLTFAKLSGANLYRANLSRANLDRANLSRANLNSANLRNANLSITDLGSANLEGANLNEANLFGANLNSANLEHADLIVAYLRSANLSNANLDGANLNGADLDNANLSEANLSKADLEGANLKSADLSNAMLSDANLFGANLNAANLDNANLTGADLDHADLSDANLSDANLAYTYLSLAKNLTQTQLDKACGNPSTRLPQGLAVKPCSSGDGKPKRRSLPPVQPEPEGPR